MNAKMKTRNMRNFKQFPRTSLRVDEIRHWWVGIDIGAFIQDAVSIKDRKWNSIHVRWVYLEN